VLKNSHSFIAFSDPDNGDCNLTINTVRSLIDMTARFKTQIIMHSD
jgi:hypothetical protein